jgi:UDP-N-acetylmuramate--alanine ligase
MNAKITPLQPKTRIPLAIGPIHFVGIGGIGMSGIAEILHHLGYKVQGTDLAENANVKRLRGKGIDVSIGHDAAHLKDAEVVVISSAVKKDNPELLAARRRLLPVVRRAEMLGELMRLKWGIAIGGTHGKTTTTSIIGSLLETADMDPTVINGGIINAYGTNARPGEGDWMVVESDESDGSFTKLPATIAVVTNIDPEHMEHYGDFDAVRQAYDTFVTNIPFYGFAVLCVDHPEVQAMLPRVSDRRLVTYGFSAQADVRGVNVELGSFGARFDAIFTDRKTGKTETVSGLNLSMFGRHNVQNALAALAVGRELGIAVPVMRKTLANFSGVKRRFTKTGEAGGITVIDDYGHHPVEIAAVLSAARSVREGRTIAVMQPHRYSRLSSLFSEFCTSFNDADIVIVADVYAAGESPIDGVNKEALVEGLRRHGHRDVHALSNPEQLPQLIADIAKPKDMVVCLGAGSITTWAQSLPQHLQDILNNPKTGKTAASS